MQYKEVNPANCPVTLNFLASKYIVTRKHKCTCWFMIGDTCQVMLGFPQTQAGHAV